MYVLNKSSSGDGAEFLDGSVGICDELVLDSPSFLCTFPNPKGVVADE